jgi:hypothetical protein
VFADLCGEEDSLGWGEDGIFCWLEVAADDDEEGEAEEGGVDGEADEEAAAFGWLGIGVLIGGIHGGGSGRVGWAVAGVGGCCWARKAAAADFWGDAG